MIIKKCRDEISSNKYNSDYCNYCDDNNSNYCDYCDDNNSNYGNDNYDHNGK